MIEIDVRGTVADGQAVLAAFATAAEGRPLGPETLTHGYTTGILSGRENTSSRTNAFTRST